LAILVRRVTEEMGLLMIMDEVVSFRLGMGGLQGLCGVRPDLTLFGKIIGGGLPVGAFGGRADLMDLLGDGSSGFFQSGTFSGHPVALAAGLAMLRELTPEAFAYLDRMGERVRAGCGALFERRGVRAQAVGDGSLFSLHFTSARLRDYRSLRTADRAAAQELFLRLLVAGILMAPGLQMNAISTPMDDSHVDALLEALECALRREPGGELVS
jgi:glutamate-1-semialdehyde 2,1-aminomutase